MSLAQRLVAYLFVTAALIGTLAQGVYWLVTPDPTFHRTAEAKSPPIPPRILESIERKKPFPVQQPAPVAPVPVLSAMQQAPVALVQPESPEPQGRPTAVKIRHPRRAAKELPAALPVTQVYVRSIATPRTDFPY